MVVDSCYFVVVAVGSAGRGGSVSCVGVGMSIYVLLLFLLLFHVYLFTVFY